MSSTQLILKNAKNAIAELRGATYEKINSALLLMADCIIDDKDKILAANKIDLELAEGKISDAMLDRLTLNDKRILGMAEGIREIARLASPVGRIINETVRPNGLVIKKVSVPIGVIAIIYESRPNVTSDAAALALKSGNVAVLRGGKEAYNSSVAIVLAMRRGLSMAGIAENAIQLISDTSRDSANELMRAKGYVDLLIPRGGKGLISACVENATVPCLETGTGICHIYVDRDADLNMALNIVENAKTSRPSVCNAAEVCLVHKDIADEFLPMLYQRLVLERKENPVELRCDARALAIVEGVEAGENDFDTEFLDYILAVGVVDSVDDAIRHISIHSTQHSEAIVTDNEATAMLFTSGVDSAAVYVNASTRFTDGGEFGLGCEMGISTQKMHARGPLGIDELTTYKYLVCGNGHIR